MRKKLSYVSYYLSLIDFLDGDIDSALKNLDNFDASNQFDSKGKNYSHALRDRIQNTIRVEALAREQKRREESEKKAYIQRIESEKRADLVYKKNQRIRAERQLPHDKYIAILKDRSWGLGSNGTESVLKPYQRRSVPSSQASASIKQLRISASWLISPSKSCTALSNSSSL